MPLKSYAKALLLVPFGAAVLAVSGCGYDGVQLNGKIFDVVGLNDTSAPKEPKLAARQPLVVPPGLDSLPPPGSGKPNQPALAVQDVDAKKGVSKAELQRQQDAYCKVNYEDAKARGDSTADSASGPLGSCHPSILTGVQKWMASGNGNEGDDDTQTQ
ncbi:hypothetical protein HYPDE_36613 [Hyphomicrobium denitrificans 1NES1]|uniref:Lipoprotein n=1 Tax=Hyphomicrobium denitrificans 1NES1 TaxID=670307 RepID=N0B620_9HYPH|nr:hypothetical protein [Hyphomicrobium denitrificans]AGK58994.1 hypothetical protein HYPDE_36613 [Hyphomicrobium denitrificans 1NES1]